MRLISAGSLVRAQSGPVFARIVEESEDCRAVALAKADRVGLNDAAVASYDSISQCRTVVRPPPNDGGLSFRLQHASRELRLGKPSSRMCKFFYVYIRQSSVDARRFYTGLTEDLPKRLKDHNSGRVFHTSKSKLWGVKTYVAFSDRGRAAEFERYLKSSSGRAFVKKHL